MQQYKELYREGDRKPGGKTHVRGMESGGGVKVGGRTRAVDNALTLFSVAIQERGRHFRSRKCAQHSEF